MMALRSLKVAALREAMSAVDSKAVVAHGGVRGKATTALDLLSHIEAAGREEVRVGIVEPAHLPIDLVLTYDELDRYVVISESPLHEILTRLCAEA